MTEYIIVTNNPKVYDNFKDKFEIDYTEYEPRVGYRVCLDKTREYIHTGDYKLETHPLSGSVKPNETPYKSMVLSKNNTNELDMDGMLILEDAIATFEKFKTNEIIKDWPDRILEDFREIDFSLIRGAIERLKY